MFWYGLYEDDCWLLYRVLHTIEWHSKNQKTRSGIMSKYTRTNYVNYQQQVTDHLVWTNQGCVKDHEQFILTDKLDDLLHSLHCIILPAIVKKSLIRPQVCGISFPNYRTRTSTSDTTK